MMSFSKAKLKRFNDVTEISSPATKEKPKKDKKAELFCDDNAIPNEKKSKMRLFRTPSLPYRLKFRQNSDLATPSKKNTKQPASQISTPTPTPASTTAVTTPAVKTPASAATTPAPSFASSIFRKSGRNLLEKKSKDEKYTEKLKSDIETLNKQIQDLNEQNDKKVKEIDDLTNEIQNMKIADENLEKIAEKSVLKVNESEEKVKEMLKNYETLLTNMDKMTKDNESLLELNEKLTKSNDEFMKINEERIQEMEEKLKTKTDELSELQTKLNEKTSMIKNFEFELGKKTMESYELAMKLEKSEETLKIFEVQHEGNLKMLKNSYENEIFFLNSQLSKAQNQLVKLSKNQKKIQSMDLESQIDFENQKTKFEIEKKNYDISMKNYQNIIEVLSIRLKKSDSDVEFIMAENAELKTENATLRTNYEKLKNSAENLKKNFDEKNQLFDNLVVQSESEMISMVTKMNDFFNEKFYEISELKKSFDVRDKNLKKMTSTILEEYTIGIELARIELDDKQKKLLEYENEIKTIKFENLQLKMKLSEGTGNKTTTLSTIEEETVTDDEKKKREEENLQLKLKLKQLDEKFSQFENAAIQRENDYKQIIEQQRLDSEQLKSFEKLKEANMDMRSKIQKLQENYQIFDSPSKTPTKRSLFFGKENQSPIFGGQVRSQIESPKAILKPRN